MIVVSMISNKIKQNKTKQNKFLGIKDRNIVLDLFPKINTFNLFKNKSYL
jgi:hypothetical protein